MSCVKHRMQEQEQERLQQADIMQGQPVKYTGQSDGSVTVVRLRAVPAERAIEGEQLTARWDYVGRFPSMDGAKAFVAGTGQGQKMCPECSSGNMAYESGCMTCYNCGWSKCE